MKLTKYHINLFEKLHKLYVDTKDVDFFRDEYGVSEQEAINLSNSAAAFRFLDDFNTNLDCQGIGFSGKREMREFFHEWLISKNWKGSKNSLAVLLRKLRKFKDQTNKIEQLNILIKKNKGNKNALKFDKVHIRLFNEVFVPENFEKTYQSYLVLCDENKLDSVSKATVYNHYKGEKSKLIKLLNTKNISHLHAQFIKLSDFDIFHKQLKCDKAIATELVNSAACLEMLNYNNLKPEIQQIGFKTKGEFLDKLLIWIKEKDWQGLNKISNVRVLTRKAAEFGKALELNREEALITLVRKKTGNQNALKFDDTHKAIVLKLVKDKKYKSKIQCFRDYEEVCENSNIIPLGEGTISQFINDKGLFEQYQKKARQYTVPTSIILTDEQKAILEYDGDLKINAVAGSGKTTTLIEYAKTRDKNSKVLYIAFNKSVKNEAIRKFRTTGIKNIDIVTAHSLAYQEIVTKENKHLLVSDLLPTEIINKLNISFNNYKEKNEKIILVTHVKRFLQYYCNSSALEIDELNYLNIILDSEVKEYVEKNIQQITKYTKRLFSKMFNGEMRFTHDFYLKAFQLKKPQLKYQYIFFDEGQDASPAMLDVFLKQSAKKIIVGDSNQQIYSWRYAVNSLEKIGFQKFELSNSFRFGRDIANLALDSLEAKKHINTFYPLTINGLGKQKDVQTKATLARTNLKLLELAINDVFETKIVKSIYFEGHISTYKFGERNSIMYDILSLYFNKKDKIQNALIKEFSSFKELIAYTKKTEDNELIMLIGLVIKYKGKLYSLINGLKEIHLSNGEKYEADMIYSTIHKCKGMEYDEVTIADDFYTENRIIEEYREAPTNYKAKKLNEEINLLYVAITRAKCKINIPAELLLNKDSIDIIKT